jgi:nickel/cobalt transporter (NiCoT) family protein
MTSTPVICLALGMRHAVDPDHLTAIDGLCRIRLRKANGVLFALGHGLVVTLLAAGVGTALAGRASFLGPWMLVTIGAVTSWKVIRSSSTPAAIRRPIIAQPFLLGMLLATGFETASQLSALVLADQTNPWLLGVAFSSGMLLVDGIDGYLATSTQRLAATGAMNARSASRWLGILVVVFSFALGTTELLGLDLDRFALPLGLSLFAVVIGFRVWARGGLRLTPAGSAHLSLSPIEFATPPEGGF